MKPEEIKKILLVFRKMKNQNHNSDR